MEHHRGPIGSKAFVSDFWLSKQGTVDIRALLSEDNLQISVTSSIRYVIRNGTAPPDPTNWFSQIQRNGSRKRVQGYLCGEKKVAKCNTRPKLIWWANRENCNYRLWGVGQRRRKCAIRSGIRERIRILSRSEETEKTELLWMFRM